MQTSAEAEEEIADSFAAAMESAEAAVDEYGSEETEAAEEAFEETAEEVFEEVSEAAEETEEDFADALEAARERWANLEDDDSEADDEDELTEESEYDSAEADEPEYEEPEFGQEESEAETEEEEPEEVAEPEPVNDGPIVPEYLQKQTMAMSPEERARRAAARASVVRTAPKQQKPAPATSVDTSMDEFTKKLKALKMAYENELITEEEFTEAKKHLLELL